MCDRKINLLTIQIEYFNKTKIYQTRKKLKNDGKLNKMQVIICAKKIIATQLETFYYYIKALVKWSKYSGDLNNKLVGYLNGPNLFDR